MRVEILDGNGAVANVIMADEIFAESNYPGAWRKVDEPELTVIERCEIVITGATVDSQYAARSRIAPDFSFLKLPVGARITITAELRMGGELLDFDGEFAMPMRSTDGFMRHIDVVFLHGFAEFSATMLDSKHWQVTEALVNSRLPADAAMNFAGIDITVVE